MERITNKTRAIKCEKRLPRKMYGITLIHLYQLITKKNIKNQKIKKLASNSPPATEYKKVRLAIQKDPPPRPKAITNLNFFNSAAGVEQKKFRTIRPIYTVPTTTTTNEAPPLAVTKPISTPSSTKKTVTFADNLFEIREYEKNPEEWANFVSIIYMI